METVARTPIKRAGLCGSSSEKPDFLLRWGNKKRLRCVKSQPQEPHSNKDKIAANSTSRDEKKPIPRRPSVYNTRKSEALASANGDAARGTRVENGNGEGGGSSSSGSGEAAVWPKFVFGLSVWEKEEDFQILKGSKLPQRPKKRAKCIQKILNQVSPGTWLADVSLDRYEVREKKISKKAQKLRGLKALESILSESE